MKKAIVLLMAIFFGVAAIAQNYRTPESFLSRIPAYPTTYKNVQVLLDSLGLQEKAIQDAQKGYAEAQKKIMSSMDQAAQEQAYKKLYQDLDSNKRKEMMQSQQQDMQNLTDTAKKDGVAKKMKSMDNEFGGAMAAYNAEVRKTIVPLDSAISAEMAKTTDKSNTDKLSGLISKRTTAYQDIMYRYLIGEKAIFPVFFTNYLAYLKGTLIPMLDRIEMAQTKIFNLSYTPHANALGAIEGYIGKYKIAIQNLKDFKEWGK